MDEFFATPFIVAHDNVDGRKPKSRRGLWFVASVLLIACSIGYTAHQYNELQREDEVVDATWALVLDQYVRRADLIPSLVVVVQRYATHESKLFNDIAEARSKVSALSTSAADSRNLRALDQFQKAQNELSASFSKVLLIAERYPELKASDLYRDLMVQLEGTENRISYRRQLYIDAVADYNITIRSFPTNLIVSQQGNKPRPKFTVENQASRLAVPKIELK